MPKGKAPLDPQPPPAPTRADSTEIVEAIVAAALELGDPDASVNLIAERAGVGVASVYRYFPNKAAIYAEVSRRLQRDFRARVQSVLEQPSLSVRDAVEACCRIAIEVPGVSAELRRALNLAVPLSWSQDNASLVFSETIEAFTHWLSSRLDPPPADLRDRVFVAFAAGRGIVMISRVLSDIAPHDEALIQHMVTGALAYLDVR